MRYVGCDPPGRTLWNRPCCADWKLDNELDYLKYLFACLKMTKMVNKTVFAETRLVSREYVDWTADVLV